MDIGILGTLDNFRLRWILRIQNISCHVSICNILSDRGIKKLKIVGITDVTKCETMDRVGNSYHGFLLYKAYMFPQMRHIYFTYINSIYKLLSNVANEKSCVWYLYGDDELTTTPEKTS